MAKNNQKKEKALRNRENAKQFKKRAVQNKRGRRPAPPSTSPSPNTNPSNPNPNPNPNPPSAE